MNALTQLIGLLRSQLGGAGSRSDVLRPLTWLIGVVLTALLLLAFEKAPSWIEALVAAAFAMLVVIFVLAYGFCLLKDRDALRTENFLLRRLEIQRGPAGDSIEGMIDDDRSRIGPTSRVSASKREIEHDK